MFHFVLRASRLAAATLIRAICTVNIAIAHQSQIQTFLTAALELVREAAHRPTWCTQDSQNVLVIEVFHLSILKFSQVGKCATLYNYWHSVSSLPSLQSSMLSHLQVVEMHWVLDIQDHWNSPQFSGVTGQSCQNKPKNMEVQDAFVDARLLNQHSNVQSLACFACTFSSDPSLQSWWPSQIHSWTRHSLLWGQWCLVVQTCAVVQPSSSEWSQQSWWPSQRITEDTHCPLAHLNSMEPQSLSTTKRRRIEYHLLV